jgi:hypothetical protein
MFELQAELHFQLIVANASTDAYVHRHIKDTRAEIALPCTAEPQKAMLAPLALSQMHCLITSTVRCIDWLIWHYSCRIRKGRKDYRDRRTRTQFGWWLMAGAGLF